MIVRSAEVQIEKNLNAKLLVLQKVFYCSIARSARSSELLDHQLVDLKKVLDRQNSTNNSKALEIQQLVREQW